MSEDEHELRSSSGLRLHGYYQYLSAQKSIDQAAVSEAYYSLVDEYSDRTLSFPTDKVFAFAAIVAQFERLDYSKHIHGLWTGDLPNCLLWRHDSESSEKWDNDEKPGLERKTNGNDTVVSSNTTSPSWSWYSYSGAVLTPEFCNGPLSTKVDSRGDPTECTFKFVPNYSRKIIISSVEEVFIKGVNIGVANFDCSRGTAPEEQLGISRELVTLPLTFGEL
ncbi:uncharacterized protein PAC_05664 [Phialocephala subalpina]|uniref:Heterokaryon incompatibility domain-containing protein n=1 Tax=Phialocephala subalpina TaxID=576137 RepID=A0A1L7WSP7_9HELO|nr:uncharacterized protein PAC_05664 [Phialocephala subalpina]